MNQRQIKNLIRYYDEQANSCRGKVGGYCEVLGQSILKDAVGYVTIWPGCINHEVESKWRYEALQKKLKKTK